MSEDLLHFLQNNLHQMSVIVKVDSHLIVRIAQMVSFFFQARSDLAQGKQSWTVSSHIAWSRQSKPSISRNFNAQRIGSSLKMSPARKLACCATSGQNSSHVLFLQQFLETFTPDWGTDHCTDSFRRSGVRQGRVRMNLGPRKSIAVHA